MRDREKNQRYLMSRCITWTRHSIFVLMVHAVLNKLSPSNILASGHRQHVTQIRAVLCCCLVGSGSRYAEYREEKLCSARHAAVCLLLLFNSWHYPVHTAFFGCNTRDYWAWCQLFCTCYIPPFSTIANSLEFSTFDQTCILFILIIPIRLRYGVVSALRGLGL